MPAPEAPRATDGAAFAGVQLWEPRAAPLALSAAPVAARAAGPSRGGVSPRTGTSRDDIASQIQTPTNRRIITPTATRSLRARARAPARRARHRRLTHLVLTSLPPPPSRLPHLAPGKRARPGRNRCAVRRSDLSLGPPRSGKPPRAPEAITPTMRRWRNWQTRWIQVPVGNTVGVQVPPFAQHRRPQAETGSPPGAFFFLSVSSRPGLSGTARTPGLASRRSSPASSSEIGVAADGPPSGRPGDGRVGENFRTPLCQSVPRIDRIDP
jgi:hypothetical protein